MKMKCTVNMSDLVTAYTFADTGEDFGHAAYIDLDTGAMLTTGADDSDLDSQVPDDVEVSERYLPIPAKRDLDLGRNLVFSFVREKLPEHDAAVSDYFRKKGAYSKFKVLLADTGKLTDWHRYEEQATELALKNWALENAVQIEDASLAQSK